MSLKITKIEREKSKISVFFCRYGYDNPVKEKPDYRSFPEHRGYISCEYGDKPRISFHMDWERYGVSPADRAAANLLASVVQFESLKEHLSCVPKLGDAEYYSA